jgi:hypothetical protein
MTATEQRYTYARASALRDGGWLGLETCGGTVLLAGPASHPRFFTGFVTEPGPAAAGLLAVAQVAAERYFLTAAQHPCDPVVTCHGDRLRFESFSGDCGVYARLDVLPGSLDGQVHDRGTTNVDVNEPLRRSLARVGAMDRLHLTVGPDELAVTTADGPVVEKKVPLPGRWLRGFAETQVLLAGCDLRAELGATEAARFVRALPGGSIAGGVTVSGARVTSGRWRGVHWLLPSGGTLRMTGGPVPGAVCLAGAHRLAALAPVLRYVQALRVYGPAAGAGSQPCLSAWELSLPGMRLTLALSPEAHRGFSGEGAVLDALADATMDDADLVGALLAFEPRVEVGLLADRGGLPSARVRRALVRLGTAGRVGYDLAEAAYFHRELPYDAALAERDNPRLRNARALVAAGAVTLDGDLATVTSGDHIQRVRFAAGGPADGAATCTCDWHAKHRGSRGPCKHVLAATMARARQRADAARQAANTPPAVS